MFQNLFLVSKQQLNAAAFSAQQSALPSALCVYLKTANCFNDPRPYHLPDQSITY
jgi:hypothetical protein